MSDAHRSINDEIRRVAAGGGDRSARDAIDARLQKANEEERERNAEIRRRVAEGESQAALAREFGISKQRVSQVLTPPRQKLRSKARLFDQAVADGLIPEDFGSNGASDG